jgi:SMI1 / KNR4 family (SUKH-1)
MVPYDFIKNAVAALAERDRALEHFGALGHRYRLNAQLTESEIAAFEQHYGARLPEDYRGFLIQVGNGGAGPHYGIFKLGEWTD